ncbi:glucokinase, partial [Serratia marcescens]
MLQCGQLFIFHFAETKSMTYALVGDVGGTNARLALCTVATG